MQTYSSVTEYTLILRGHRRFIGRLVVMLHFPPSDKSSESRGKMPLQLLSSSSEIRRGKKNGGGCCRSGGDGIDERRRSAKSDVDGGKERNVAFACGHIGCSSSSPSSQVKPNACGEDKENRLRGHEKEEEVESPSLRWSSYLSSVLPIKKRITCIDLIQSSFLTSLVLAFLTFGYAQAVAECMCE